MTALAVIAAALTPIMLEALSSRSPEPPAVLQSASRIEPAPRPAALATSPDAAPLRVAAAPSRDRSIDLILSPPYEIADGLTIVSETRRVRLAGLEGPAAEAACFDPNNHLWACGLQARAALHNLIRLQPVTCRTTGAKVGDAMLADCRVGSTRLDRAIVQQGFARPAAGAPDLSQEVAEAKIAPRGLWNGGWRIKP